MYVGWAKSFSIGCSVSLLLRRCFDRPSCLDGMVVRPKKSPTPNGPSNTTSLVVHMRRARRSKAAGICSGGVSTGWFSSRYVAKERRTRTTRC
jgi:hypothetical protein